jgi:hyperosmotically inducible protein
MAAPSVRRVARYAKARGQWSMQRNHLENSLMNRFNRISALLAAIALLGIVGCASTAKQESTGQYVDDTTITTKVKAAILNDPTLKSAEINVETFKGRVQLSGFVSSKANIDQAVIVAQAVGGVTSVRNDMRLK